MNTPGKKKRVYDQKFKEAAVEMYVNGQRSGPAVARDLGICRRTLHLTSDARWTQAVQCWIGSQSTPLFLHH